MDRSDEPSADESADPSVDRSADGRWLTYRELAQLRGIDIASAKRQANRGRWRRQKGNSGREVRVLVPDALTADRSADTTADLSTDRTADASADIARLISMFETGLVALREQLAVANERAQAAEQRALAAEQGREGAVAQGNELRARIEVLQASLERATSEAGRAVQALEERERADAARKAQGRWARLRRAWRGR